MLAGVDVDVGRPRHPTPYPAFLITAHIGPDLAEAPSWAHVTTHDGGTTTRIEWRDGARRHRRRSRVGGGLRGTVSDFSKASRRRLFRLLGTVNRFSCPRPPAFLTVTYPGVWLQKAPQVRANMRALLKRLRRRFGDLAVIWRLEYQKRGAPHIHMLVFDPPDLQTLREWAHDAWYEIVGTQNEWHRERGVDVTDLNSWRQVSGYVGKYLGKLHDGNRVPADHEGRFWGVECRDALPTAPVSYALAVKDGLRARRWLLRAAGRGRRVSGPLKSASVLVDSRAVARMVSYLSGLPVTWVGHRCRPPGELCWELALAD